MFTLVVFYPGVMSTDSIIQLEEARSRALYDWHPPLMAWVWGFLDRAMPGPAGMLLLHTVMFWTGLALTMYLCAFPPVRSAFAILAIGLCPPVLSTLGTVWKDVGMASSLLLAVSLLLYAHLRSSAIALGLALVPLFYGVAVRYNAALAAYPLALWAGLIADRLKGGRSTRRLLRSVVIGHIVFAALGLMVLAVNKVLVDGRHLFPSQQVLIHDLAGVSVRTDTVFVPGFLASQPGPVTLAELRCLYTPSSAVAVFNGRHDRCPSRLKKITNGHRMSELRYIWLRAVVTHIGPYVAHRLSVWQATLGLGDAPVCYPVQVGIVPNSLGLEFRASALYVALLEIVAVTARATPLFRPWVYLALTVALLGVALSTRRAGVLPAVSLGASGLLYGLGYLVVAPTCDFRMSWWSVVVALVLPALVWHRAAERPTDGWSAG